jgi:prepilin-type N-terminal cleavage/methylation domain-containing protein
MPVTARPRRIAGARGVTLIEVLAALAIGTIVTSSLYLLVGNAIKARLIISARVADQEQGRLALMWLADRVRQVNYDPQAACPDGLLRMGSGSGFGQRLSFRAVLDEDLTPPRRMYVYYQEQEILWQETLIQNQADECADELDRASPHPQRVALTPPIVRAFQIAYADAAGLVTTDPARVRLVHIVLTVYAPGASGRPEMQTYGTAVGVRGP